MMDRSKSMAATVDAILDEISQLSIEDQEMLDEIVHKRIIEGKREEIRAAYLAAVEERKQGKTMSGSVDDLFGAIDS
jgi:hypothetical protein